MKILGNLCVQNILSNNIQINDMVIKTGESLEILQNNVVQYTYSISKDDNDELKMPSFKIGTDEYEMFATTPSGYEASDDTYPLVLYVPGFYGFSESPLTTSFQELLLNSDDSPFSYTSKRGKNYDPSSSFRKYIWVALNIYSQNHSSLDDGVMPSLTINTALTQCIHQVFSTIKLDKNNTTLCGTSIGGQAVIANIPTKVFDIFTKIVLLDCGPKTVSSERKYWNYPSGENSRSFGDSNLKKWFDLYFGEPSNIYIESFIASQSSYFERDEISALAQYLSTKGVTMTTFNVSGTRVNEAAVQVFKEKSNELFT